jgi:hypothetical protein
MATTPRTQQIGDNISARVEGRKLIIEIDLDQDFGLSSSGKSTTIASSRGNARIDGTDATLGLNLYTPVKRR